MRLLIQLSWISYAMAACALAFLAIIYGAQGPYFIVGSVTLALPQAVIGALLRSSRHGARLSAGLLALIPAAYFGLGLTIRLVLTLTVPQTSSADVAALAGVAFEVAIVGCNLVIFWASVLRQRPVGPRAGVDHTR